MSRPPIYIISQFTLEPWDWRTPWTTGIGGSEQSHIEMVARLAKRGLPVVSLAPVPPESHTVSNVGVEWFDSRRTGFPEGPAWIVNYRCPALFNRPKPAGQKWIYVSQDVDAGGWTVEARAKVDRYLCLCEEHAKWTGARYPDLKDRIFISGNGVRSDYLEELLPVERVPWRMLYASSPDRGLALLLQNWFRIKERMPEATLHVAYGFDNMVKVIEAQRGQGPLAQLKRDLDGMLTQDGIKWLGRLPMDALYRELQEAHVYAYPSDWPETNCISIQDAMALGCIPVTTNFWAQGEWAKAAPLSYVCDTLPQRSDLAKCQWLDALEDALTRSTCEEFDRFAKDDGGYADLDNCCDYLRLFYDVAEPRHPITSRRDCLQQWARRRFDWENVVDQWQDWYEKDIKV